MTKDSALFIIPLSNKMHCQNWITARLNSIRFLLLILAFLSLNINLNGQIVARNAVGYLPWDINFSGDLAGNFNPESLTPFDGFDFGAQPSLFLDRGLFGIDDQGVLPVSVSMYYSVHLQSQPPGPFIEIPLPFDPSFIPDGLATVQYRETDLNFDVLAGLPVGDYFISIYWEALFVGAPPLTDGSPVDPLQAQVEVCLDSAPPIAICQDLIVQLDASGNAAITAEQIDNGSSDECGPVFLEIDNTTFTCTEVQTEILALSLTSTAPIQVGGPTNEWLVQPLLPQIPGFLDRIRLELFTHNGIGDLVVRIGDGQPNDGQIIQTELVQMSLVAPAPVIIDIPITDPVLILPGQPIFLELGGQNGASFEAPVMPQLAGPFGGIDPLGLQQGQFPILPPDPLGEAGPLLPVQPDPSVMGLELMVQSVTPVTLTVTDNAGNTSTCTSIVTVEDNETPTAICQDITIELDLTGNVSITAAQLDNGSTSNTCSNDENPPSVTIGNNIFDCSNIGANTVILTVTDGSGNSDTCTSTVTVTDIDSDNDGSNNCDDCDDLNPDVNPETQFIDQTRISFNPNNLGVQNFSGTANEDGLPLQADLHDFGLTQSLILTGGEIRFYHTCPDPFVGAGEMYYSFYLQGDPVPPLSSFDLLVPLEGVTTVPEGNGFFSIYTAPPPKVIWHFSIDSLPPGEYYVGLYWQLSFTNGDPPLRDLSLTGGPHQMAFEICDDVDNDGSCPPDDCDDNNASIYPGKTELCNGVDDNCNGVIDEDVIPPYVICPEDVELDCSALANPLPSDACILPDNGQGTVEFIDPLCEIVTDKTIIHIGYLIHDVSIDVTIEDIVNVQSNPGGTLGGDLITFDADVILNMTGLGPLAGFSRFPTVFTPDIQIETGPATPGDPIQTFPTNLVKLEVTFVGDPDFDFFELRAGSFFGLPSPGETTLHRLGNPGSSFNVDSFFDVVYQIEWQGAPGSLLDGLGSVNPPPALSAQMRIGLPFQPCEGLSTAPDNGTGTPDFSDPYAYRAMMIVTDGLPPQTNADPPSYYKWELENVIITSFSTGPSVTFPGGTDVTFDGTMDINLNGFGILTGFSRTFNDIPFTNALIAEGPRTPGDPVQSFPTEMIALEIELPPGDPDFDFLRLRIGSSFGLPPSPGQSTLTDLGNGNFNVDSFFDIHYEIEFQGAPGGALDGMGGITTAPAQMTDGSAAGSDCAVGASLALAIDQCDPFPLCVVADLPQVPDPPYVSSILRTYTCTDASGNSSSCSHFINFLPELDTDADGTCDALDECPFDGNKILAGDCGCGEPDLDSDVDGVSDCLDNCPDDYNPFQEDSDDDGWGLPCDCDDNNSDVFPGAVEYCDSIDNDCDGLVDENCDQCVEENFQHVPTDLFTVQTATTTQLFWKHYSDATSGCLVSSQRLDTDGNDVQSPINFAITGPAKISPDINGNNKSGKYVADQQHIKFNSNTFPSGNTANWLPGWDYKWRVRCACIINENLPFPDRVKNFNLHLGPWSEWDFFTNLELPPIVESNVPGNESEKGNLNFYKVGIIPNPTDGLTSVQIISDSDQLIRYNVYDLFGRKIQENVLIIANGMNYFELDLTGESSGIYILELLNEESMITRQIVKY